MNPLRGNSLNGAKLKELILMKDNATWQIWTK